MKGVAAVGVALFWAGLLGVGAWGGDEDLLRNPNPAEPPRMEREDAARLAQSTLADILAALQMPKDTADSRQRAWAGFKVAVENFSLARLRLAEEPDERPGLIVYRMKEAPKCDGASSEWAQIPAVRLERWPQIWLAGQRDTGIDVRLEQWRGPEDLSALFRAGWDEKHLYLCVEAVDDAHLNDSETGGQAWNGDALQVAVSCAQEPLPTRNYKVGDGEWVCARLKDGSATVWSVCVNGKSANEATSVPAAVVRNEEKKRTIYELALPWSLLAIQPVPGRSFSLTFCVNDMDPQKTVPGQDPGTEEKRVVDKCVALTPGIWEPKFPGRFARACLADFTLPPPPQPPPAPVVPEGQ